MVKETIRIGAVVSDFNYDITMMMFERAKEHAELLGAEITKVVKVPGVFDMGLAVKKLLMRKAMESSLLGQSSKGKQNMMTSSFNMLQEKSLTSH